MVNPYILLACLIGAIGMFGSGVSIGYKWSERSHVADVVAAQNAAIAGANAAAYAERERAVAAARTEAAARLTARTARMKGELDAALKSRPECSRDAESVRLLNDAIRVGNGQAPAPDKLPVAVRPTARTPEWFRVGREKLGILGGGDLRDLPPPTR